MLIIIVGTAHFQDYETAAHGCAQYHHMQTVLIHSFCLTSESDAGIAVAHKIIIRSNKKSAAYKK